MKRTILYESAAALYCLSSLTLLAAFAQPLAAPTYFTTGHLECGPASLAVGDFNEDDNIDIAIAKNDNVFFYPCPVTILLGDGSGRFGEPRNWELGCCSPRKLVVGDVNNDGHLDIVAVNAGGFTISALLGDGRGSVLEVVDTDIGGGEGPIAAADLNDDGRTDIVVTRSRGSFGRQRGILAMMGDGHGGFRQVSFLETELDFIGLGMWNDDRYPDLVGYGGRGLFVRGNTGDGTFGLPTSFPITNGIAAAVGDFNSDSDIDLSILTSSGVEFWFGDGSENFPRKVISRGFPGGSFGMTVGDLNGDTYPDLIVPRDAHRASVGFSDENYRVCTEATSISYTDRIASDFSGHIIAADVNHDGRSDIIVSQYESEQIGVFLAEAPGNPSPVPTCAVTSAVCTGDCDGDEHVIVSELITAVNIALGSSSISTCDPADQDGNRSVGIQELVSAVQNALGGCQL